MAFRGKHVSRLSVTRLAVWNAGTEPIRESDIPDGETLKVTTRDGITVLATEVLEVTRAANHLSISVQSAEAFPHIKFDFLDPGDRALIDVIPDGTGPADVALEGTIVGGTIRRMTSEPETVPVERSASRAKSQSGRQNARAGATIFTVAGLVLVGLAFIVKDEGRAVIAGVGALIAMIGIGIYAYSRRVYPPTSIRHFDSDL